LATFSYGVHDCLLLIKSVKVAALVDFGVIFIQVASYVILNYIGETSYFVSVLISMTTSYLVMICAVLLLIIYVFSPKYDFSLQFFTLLLKQVSIPNLVTFTNLILERIDKLFLGFQTSTLDLGRFSTSQSMVSVTRFLPDSLAKLSLVRNKSYISQKFHTGQYVLFSSFLAILLSLFSFLFTNFLLGSEWALPVALVFFVALVEVVRGTHMVLVAETVRHVGYEPLRVLSIFQLVIGVCLQPIAICLYGVSGSVGITLVVLTIGVINMVRINRV
jgi:hypothetical protein